MIVLEVTTNIGCVNACKVCPQTLITSKYEGNRQMIVQDFAFCLASIPKWCEVRFCGYSEPFLNPNCGKMIQLVRNLGFHSGLLTTLVGFNTGHIDPIKLGNLHYIRFHVPDTEQFVFPFDRWIELHKLFWSMRIPADYDFMTMGTVPHEILEYLNSIGIPKVLAPRMNSRAGNLWDGANFKGNTYCADNRWHYNVLVPNGDVYLCCMDYGLKHKLGNLLQQPYSEIYQEAERLRLADHSDMICAKCELARPGTWHNPFGRPTI